MLHAGIIRRGIGDKVPGMNKANATWSYETAIIHGGMRPHDKEPDQTSRRSGCREEGGGQVTFQQGDEVLIWDSGTRISICHLSELILPRPLPGSA